MTDGAKRCPACQVEKPLDQFYRLARSKDGRQGYCKPCANAKRQQWKREHPEREAQWRAAGSSARRRRRSSRFARYGITELDYERMLAHQGGRCASCAGSVGGALHIDHDHSCCSTERRSCGECVRGLLCPKCNLALGLLDDSPEKIAALLLYITSTRKGRPSADDSEAGVRSGTHPGRAPAPAR